MTKLLDKIINKHMLTYEEIDILKQSLQLLNVINNRIMILEDDRMHQSYEKQILKRMLGRSKNEIL